MSFGDPVVCSNIVDCGNQCQNKNNNISICCFSVKNWGEGAGWFGIRMMCLSGTTCLPIDCCYYELEL